MVRKVGRIRYASQAEREAFEELKDLDPRNIKPYSLEYRKWRLFGHEKFKNSEARDFTNEVANRMRNRDENRKCYI